MDVGLIIEAVRNKKAISEPEMREFAANISSAFISDAQIGAFAMAVSLNGLNFDARVGLTKGMRDSGQILSWDLSGPVLDKHSTGGVGDPVSLILAPALVACGVYVPMVSGRGLGFTGGTLDKLESIPGYASKVSSNRFQEIVKKVGFAIVSASEALAPADQRLYKIRDVTGTVNSIDLITSSILSKKLSVGLDGLVLDIKTGSGAVIKDFEESMKLAKSLVDIANDAGCPTTALITDMSQPLVNSVGNALEIKSIMETLSDPKVESRFLKVVIELGAELLSLNQPEQSISKSRKLLIDVITSGKALEYFLKMVFEMGGPLNFESKWTNILPTASKMLEVTAGKEGYITKIDTELLGRSILLLGGGRVNENDIIDPSVGLTRIVEIGSKVDTKTPLAIIHAPNKDIGQNVEVMIKNSFTISDKKKSTPKLITQTSL
jgi:thymidine phosphorylase